MKQGTEGEMKSPEPLPVADAAGTSSFSVRPAQGDWPSPDELAAAPADFNLNGQKIADEIKKRRGYAFAGQVVVSKGAPLKKGTYRVSVDGKDANLYYDNGWFTTRRQYDLGATSCKCLVTTFQHRVEFAQEIVQGKVNFQQITLEAAPDEQLTTIKGKVQDEKNKPVADARVKLSLNHSTSIETTTDAKGEYSFQKILPQAYGLTVTSKEHYGSYARCDIEPGREDGMKWTMGSEDGLSRQEDQTVLTTILFPRRVVIDAILQPDGSTSFASRNLPKDRFTLELFGNTGLIRGSKKTGGSIVFDPTAKETPDGIYDVDMYLCVNNGVCSFSHARRGGFSGLYTLGKVDFASVKKADPEQIRIAALPCEANHVYVIRTNQNGLYVKFVVRSVVVGDRQTAPAPPPPRRVSKAEANRQIFLALGKNIDIDFGTDASFEDLFHLIVDKNPGINVDLDSREVGSFGITRQTPVATQHVKYSGITLRSAL